MKWLKIWWSKREEREHVLGRWIRLLPVARDWSRPESEPVLRVVRLWWTSLILWVHSSRSAAGFWWYHVGIGVGFLVAEDSVHHRRCAAGCRGLSAARAALYQVSVKASFNIVVYNTWRVDGQKCWKNHYRNDNGNWVLVRLVFYAQLDSHVF